MAITYPYSLAAFADRLKITEVVWDIQRNDELSGLGDARVWQTELADPLWTGDVKLAPGYHKDVKQIAALVRKLHGAQEAFYLFDPLSMYPQADPNGSILGSSSVQVHAVGADRNTLRLKGLPASYALTLGDKGQVAFSSDPVQNYFFEVSEDIGANGSGVTAAFEVFPHVPPGVVEDDVVTLAKPACRVFIMPGSSNPGSASGLFTSGAGFKVMERRR
jgi:hypothetical protein